MQKAKSSLNTRKDGKHLRVPVLASEESVIKANAARASLTVAEYLRRLSLGHVIKGTIDSECVQKLAKVNADQGRLGGLLKLWLTDDAKLTFANAAMTPGAVRALLRQIEATQSEMWQLVQSLKF